MQMILLWIAAYLLGSINFSYIFTKFIKKQDIRTIGSGNAGATNTMRVLGVGPAICVLLLDALKGMAPVWAAGAADLPTAVAVAAGLLAIIGHNWPLFHGFKGGKGVATTIGVFLVVSFIPSLIAGVIVLVIIAFTRYVSLGSIVFMIVAPVLMILFKSLPMQSSLIVVVIGLLSIWRHKENIGRLVKGKERKLGK